MLSHVKLASNRERPRLAIIGHDGKKADLVAFATFNRSRLQEYDIVATGATGDLLRDKVGLEVERVTSGPHGGDVQIASRVVEGDIDAVLFMVDPLDKHPQQITWPPPGTYKTENGKRALSREKYRAAPVDEHMDLYAERITHTDIEIAKTVLVPAIRALEKLHKEVTEENIAIRVGQHAPFVRRRLLALWKSDRRAVWNRGDGFWESPEHHDRRVAEE